ncbi:MAG: hypothetical protein HY598_03525 [Candidatus Omnitrophica bacterium]|nr:hypothetical protein [Candidatus Omnitrophota bacterium]
MQDPYAAVIRRLNQYGVRYVVVGMAGINYYAEAPHQAFATMDYDILLEPTLANVEQTLRCLKRLRFAVGTAAGPLQTNAVKAIVRQRRTLVATTPDGLMVELLLEVSGYTFSELARDAKTFTVRGVPVKVGQLTKLLMSKKVAGRPKDRQFLRRYQALLDETSA